MELNAMGQRGQVYTEIKKTDFKQVINDATLDVEAKEKVYREEEISKALIKLNKFLQEDNTRAEYEFHEVFGDTIIKIIDNDTKEVIMEVPPRKILDFVARICEIAGVLVDKKA